MANANANAIRPLLVVQDAEEGQYLVYDLRLELEEKLEVRPLPRPVMPPLNYRPLAVFQDAVLGAPTRTFLIPVGDTLIKMDTAFGGTSVVVEALTLLPGGRTISVPLPSPPTGDCWPSGCLASITAYFVMGMQLWISMPYPAGISYLDTDKGVWHWYSMWPMPFWGRAIFVPELANVVGLTRGGKSLTSLKLRDDGKGVNFSIRNNWPQPVECDHAQSDHASLAYLGGDKFCICKGINVVLERQPGSGHPITRYKLNSLMPLQVLRGSNGSLQVRRWGKMSYHGGMWPEGPCVDPYLLQSP